MRGKKKLLWIGPVAVVGIALFLFVGGQIVMHLWNWLLPALFGWRMITFWQALGLLVLCRILFGGFGGHSHRRSGFRRQWDDRWRKMTPEERQQFRQRMRERCGFGPPAPEGPSTSA
jgi:hypothetical protein